MSTFALPDGVSFEEGAALPMNYLTAQFALAERGQLRAGETVLVHGAAGGVGTATIQVAKGYGARTIAVVSTEEKAAGRRACRRRRRRAARRASGTRSMELTAGRGVDVVVDVVGGDAFTDSLRVLAPQGRLLVVGFAAGQGIPQVKVNRLLLNNVDVRGVGWGAYAMVRPGLHGRAVAGAGADDGERRGRARRSARPTTSRSSGRRSLDMEQRRTLGKSVVRVRG